MGKVLVNGSTMAGIASAIREKAGTSKAMLPGEMAAAIRQISKGVEIPDLTNPAAADNIQKGFEAVSETGEIIVGTHEEAAAPSLPALSNPAGAAQILSGYEAINGNGAKMTGSHVCKSLAEMTSDGTAIAPNILKDRVAYVNGERLVGTMGLHEDEDRELSCGESFYIIGGYHTGANVSVKTLAEQTPGTATAAQIANGATAWVNGSKVTGTHSCPVGYQYEYVTTSYSTTSKTSFVFTTSLNSIKSFCAHRTRGGYDAAAICGFDSGSNKISYVTATGSFTDTGFGTSVTSSYKKSISGGTLTITAKSETYINPLSILFVGT